MRESPPLAEQTPHTLQKEIRIATASVRTDLAMTVFAWSVVHGRRATARVAPTEGYKECLADGRTGASAPTDSLVAGEAGDREGRSHAPPSFHFPLPPFFDIVNDDFHPPCGRFGHPANFYNFFIMGT